MTGGRKALTGSVMLTGSALLCGIILAAVMNGPSAFSSLSLPLMFVIFCFAGGLMYSVLKYRGTRDLVFTVFVITLLHLLAFRVVEPRFFLEFFLYYAMLGLSVWIYSRHVVPGLRGFKIGKFIALAVIIVVLYSAVTVIAGVFLGGRDLSQSLTGIIKVQSLVGVALGLGLEAGEILRGRLASGRSR